MQQGNCHDCGKFRRSLHRHHLKPRSKGGTDADGTVLLCANCHEDRHGGCFANEVSPASRLKHSRNLKKKWRDPKFRARGIANMHKVQKISHSPENKAKRGKAMKNLWADPAYREKMSKSRKASWAKLTPAQRAKRTKGFQATYEERSERSRKVWAGKSAEERKLRSRKMLAARR